MTPQMEFALMELPDLGLGSNAVASYVDGQGSGVAAGYVYASPNEVDPLPAFWDQPNQDGVFALVQLPTLNGNQARVIGFFDDGEGGFGMCGQALSGTGIQRAVAWELDGQGFWQIEILPALGLGFGGAPMSGIHADGTAAQIVGNVFAGPNQTDPQPAVWRREASSDNWDMTTLPLEGVGGGGGYGGGGGALWPTGYVIDGQDNEHAVLWTSDDGGGTWDLHMLGEIGPNSASRSVISRVFPDGQASIVGTMSQDGANPVGALWSKKEPGGQTCEEVVAHDINDILAIPDWLLIDATGIGEAEDGDPIIVGDTDASDLLLMLGAGGPCE